MPSSARNRKTKKGNDVVEQSLKPASIRTEAISVAEQIRIARDSGHFQDVPDGFIDTISVRPSEVHDGLLSRRTPTQPLVRLEGEGVDDSSRGGEHQKVADDEHNLADEIFDALVYIVPFASLFLLLDILAHKQYNRHPETIEYVKRLAQAVPTISVIVFYAHRYAASSLNLFIQMAASILCGCRLIWLMNKAPFLVVIQQAPPVGTLWVITVVELPLGRALISLAVVAAWIVKAKMKIFAS